MDVWKLDATPYVLQGDDLVRDLMRQLRVPNLFARAAEYDAMHAFVAFDNHPSHWIVLHLFQGGSSYSPNHVVHKFVADADPNGLLFEAIPKSSCSREQMEELCRTPAHAVSATVVE